MPVRVRPRAPQHNKWGPYINLKFAPIVQSIIPSLGFENIKIEARLVILIDDKVKRFLNKHGNGKL